MFFFCVELFCGTGNLTYAMKHYFPDSFGVDHKVGKQRVKIVCLVFDTAGPSRAGGIMGPLKAMFTGVFWHPLRKSINSEAEKA